METAAYKRLVEMFVESQSIIRNQAESNLANQIGLLDISQVCELTGYRESFIRARKAEIGYHTVGKDLKFKPAAVQAWIDTYYRSPVVRKSS